MADIGDNQLTPEMVRALTKDRKEPKTIESIISSLSDDQIKALDKGDFSSIDNQTLLDIEEATKEVRPEVQEQRDKLKDITSNPNKYSPENLISEQERLNLLESGLSNEQLPFRQMDPRTRFSVKGQQIAEGLAESGTNPKLAAGVGTAFSMIPPTADATIGLGLGMGSVKLAGAGKKAYQASELAQAIKQTGKREAETIAENIARLNVGSTKVKSSAKIATKTLSQMVKDRISSIERPLKEQGLKLKQALNELPTRQRRIAEQLGEEVIESKGLIAEAEEDLGVGLSKIGPEEYNKLIKEPSKFASKYSKVIDNLGVDKMADNLNTETLQTIRKAAENGRKLNSIDDGTRVLMAKIEAGARNAIAKQSKEFDTAISRFTNAQKQLKELPKQFKKQEEIISKGIKNIENLMKQKTLSDPQLLKLKNNISIVQRQSAKLPARFDARKAELQLALKQAQNKAAQQADLTKSFWLKAAGIATGAAIFGLVQRTLPRE